MNGRAPAILDHLAALADTTRSRILLLLDRHELTVSELCGIVQLPQSTVSRHLKALADSGWIAARSEGTSRLYTMTHDELDEGQLDAATLMLVLHHVPEPGHALAEVARTLKAGGRTIIVDMLPHDRESYRQQMGHVWLGFSDDHVRRMLSDAGFDQARVVPLAPDARAKGPGLFVSTARKPH
jgi:DNA-binding transcriptional ArsR family regulator